MTAHVSKRVLIRKRDVLYALQLASESIGRLNRIQLQKVLYLTDCTMVIFEATAPSRGHKTYYNGPFDSAIQAAVDSLVFCAYVAVDEVRRDEQGRVNCFYRLTPAGKTLASRLRNTDALVPRFEATQAVVERVSVAGWHRLIALAYADPTFVERRRIGFGQEIDVESASEPSTANLIDLLVRALPTGRTGGPPSRELMVEALFRYLELYANARGVLRNQPELLSRRWSGSE